VTLKQPTLHWSSGSRASDVSGTLQLSIARLRSMSTGFLAEVTRHAELSGVAGWMASLIDALGPIGVGLVIVAETLFPPIPSEAVLPAAGYLTGLGELGFWPTLAWATAGSVAGALGLYWAGAAVGTERLGRLAAWLPMMPSRDVERAWATFDRWQQPAVFWGRLIPGVRSLVSIPAGAQGMPLGRFTALTAAGSAIWNLVLMGAGWWLGDRYGATTTVSRWINLGLGAGAVGFVVWFVARRVGAKHVPLDDTLVGQS
jgi:membrane protein DedA with SNARE-associated domain